MNTTLSVIEKSSKYDDHSIYAIGDKIQLHCIKGYRRLEGNTSLTCNETGQWNGQPLRCEGNSYSGHRIYLISQNWLEKQIAEKNYKNNPQSNNYEVCTAVALCFPNILARYGF
jgi:hypothetical protein